MRLGLPETFFKRKLEQVYYYGAGCTSYEKKNVLGASLVAQFKTPIHVESDLLAAARGLFKCEAGIACILGTGSNSVSYTHLCHGLYTWLPGRYWQMRFHSRVRHQIQLQTGSKRSI